MFPSLFLELDSAPIFCFKGGCSDTGLRLPENLRRASILFRLPRPYLNLTISLDVVAVAARFGLVRDDDETGVFAVASGRVIRGDFSAGRPDFDPPIGNFVAVEGVIFALKLLLLEHEV